jgi:hypothetical protein
MIRILATAESPQTLDRTQLWTSKCLCDLTFFHSHFRNAINAMTEIIHGNWQGTRRSTALILFQWDKENCVVIGNHMIMDRKSSLFYFRLQLRFCSYNYRGRVCVRWNWPTIMIAVDVVAGTDRQTEGRLLNADWVAIYNGWRVPFSWMPFTRTILN